MFICEVNINKNTIETLALHNEGPLEGEDEWGLHEYVFRAPEDMYGTRITHVRSEGHLALLKRAVETVEMKRKEIVTWLTMTCLENQVPLEDEASLEEEPTEN